MIDKSDEDKVTEAFMSTSIGSKPSWTQIAENAWRQFSEDVWCAGYIGVTEDTLAAFRSWLKDGNYEWF